MSALGATHARPVRVLATMTVLTALVVVFAGVAMAAGLVSTGGLTRPGLLGGNAAATHQIGDDVETSFGSVEVEFMRSVDGLSHRSLAGATHGVPGLINTQHAQIQAALAVTNREQEPLQFGVDQVRLRVAYHGNTTVQRPTGGNLPDTRVLANAGIEGQLDFVVPAKGARLTLQFEDPGTGDPVLINLGRTNFTAAGTGHTHQ